MERCFPHWEEPIAFTSEERELQTHIRIHLLRAQEVICVVAGLRTEVLLLSECRDPCVLSAASARGGGRWGSGGLGLRTSASLWRWPHPSAGVYTGTQTRLAPVLGCTCLHQSQGLHSQEGLCKIPRSWCLIVWKTQLWCVDGFL